MRRITRRDFIKQTAAGVCTASLLDVGQSLAKQQGGIPTRPLGKTGVNVSILGLGGAHLGAFDVDKEAVTFTRKAIDMGVTFMDNAWEYGDGRCEDIMGKALLDGYRDKVFLMTKHHGRDKKTAMEHLEDSLRKLKTDVIDLWQFHEVVYPDDPEWIFTRGGIEAAEEAKKSGKVRFIGFTGHKHPDIHLDMLNRDYEWDAVQMPINVMDAHFRSFLHNVVPVLRARKIGIIGMKSLGGRHVLRAEVVEAEEAIRFALSQPIDTLVSGMHSNEILDANVAIAREFQPMRGDIQEKVLAKTEKAAAEGIYEPFKTTINFDAKVGRKQHGIPLDD